MTNITVPGSRKPSAQCEAFIKGFEECRLASFMPTPNDVPTIGWGTTAGVRMGMIWSQAECDERFHDDLAVFAAAVDRLAGMAPTTQGQFDAMVCLIYNIGIKNFVGSTVLRDHRAGRNAAAAAAFALWNKQKGKVLRGLTARRAAEAKMYEGTA